MKSRTQGSRPRPRPRTQKKSEAKAKDSLSEDRHSRGQGQECSRPRPRTKDTKRKCSPKKKKKRSSQKFFRRSPKKKKKKRSSLKIFQAISTKKTFSQKIFQAVPQNFNIPKNSAVLEPRDRPIFEDLRPRGQDLTFEAKAKDFKICPRGRPRGLHLCCILPIAMAMQSYFSFLPTYPTLLYVVTGYTSVAIWQRLNRKNSLR